MIEPKENTQLDEKKDMTATTYLFQALPEDMIIQVASCKSAKEIWDALKTRHVGADRVQKSRLQTLKTEFEILKMKEDDTIDSFTARLNGILTRASTLGSTFDQPTLVRKLLSSVPRRFVHIIATIEQFADLETTTLDETIGRLKAYEERTNLVDENLVDNQEKLMFTRRDKNYSRGRHFGNHGQGRFNSSQDCPESNQRGKELNLVQEDNEPTLLTASKGDCKDLLQQARNKDGEAHDGNQVTEKDHGANKEDQVEDEDFILLKNEDAKA
ncbi:uncharacterized protein LOC110933963 [Helianthus annuus]|uniref:uncharacterized protein LOC110933963 n=1 Tax=Helianthus annuus TaxID=4232 RepID=UPI000B8F6B92|nr:uncharacterized protein LOC110933963 [Helianthus annuus]